MFTVCTLTTRSRVNVEVNTTHGLRSPSAPHQSSSTVNINSTNCDVWGLSVLRVSHERALWVAGGAADANSSASCVRLSGVRSRVSQLLLREARVAASAT